MDGSAGAQRQRRRSSVLGPIDLGDLVATMPDTTHEQWPRVKGDSEEGAGTLGGLGEKSLLDRQGRSVFGPGIVVKSANAFKETGPEEEEVVLKVRSQSRPCHSSYCIHMLTYGSLGSRKVNCRNALLARRWNGKTAS